MTSTPTPLNSVYFLVKGNSARDLGPGLETELLLSTPRINGGGVCPQRSLIPWFSAQYKPFNKCTLPF